MENPTDRVTYGDLRMIRDEFEELMQLSIEAGTLKHPVAYEKYVDESFAKAARAAVDRHLTMRSNLACLNRAAILLLSLLLAGVVAMTCAQRAARGRR